jgi:hypothetical protein
LFEPSDGADVRAVRVMLDRALARGAVAPLLRKWARRSPATLGQWGWEVNAPIDKCPASTVAGLGKAQGHMNSPSSIGEPLPDELSNSRFRSTSTIALGSALPGAAPAFILTGSFALCALVAVLVAACVGIAAHMI